MVDVFVIGLHAKVSPWRRFICYFGAQERELDADRPKTVNESTAV